MVGGSGVTAAGVAAGEVGSGVADVLSGAVGEPVEGAVGVKPGVAQLANASAAAIRTQMGKNQFFI